MIIEKQPLLVKSNITDFNIDKIIGIVKRDNNTKRSFLLLNKMQSKHYPSDPIETDMLFSKLAETILCQYKNKKNILVIGFAETAVAIGTYVASAFENSYYIQTTREDISGESYLTFDEVHSHAVTHKIYTKNLKEIVETTDLIIIVDDEFTTGNTAMNLISSLKNNYKIRKDCAICISSILSCMKQKYIQNLQKNNISLISLIETQLKEESIEFPNEFSYDNTVYDNFQKKVFFYQLSGKVTPIFLTLSSDYINECNKFVVSAFEIINSVTSKDNVLVIGTEEFSFCALKLGIALKNITNDVKIQCTTQSPVMPSFEKGYIINSRACFRSLYNESRTTYIYQMKHYDIAVILTDSENPSEQAKKQLIDSINADRIFFIQWRK